MHFLLRATLRVTPSDALGLTVHFPACIRPHHLVYATGDHLISPRTVYSPIVRGQIWISSSNPLEWSRHDVTLETNHLGLVTTKRSVVRSKNKQKGRIWVGPPSRCLWGPSMRDSYERFRRSMLSHHYHGELRFILDVVINLRINPFLTTKTSRDKQKTPPKCLLRFNTWT